MSAYIGMVCDTLKNSIPKAVVFCQVREAKRALLNTFYIQVGRREVILLNSFNYYAITYSFVDRLKLKNLT